MIINFFPKFHWNLLKKFEVIAHIAKIITPKNDRFIDESFGNETLEADKNQGIDSISKATSFLCTIKEKKKTLTELTDVNLILENEYKKT